jgi:ABC-type transport system substrate-binding protein
VPGLFLRMFVLNTSRPLFRKNPKLRQAVNFAVDRKALTRELGPFAGTPTDQYQLPLMPGYRDERIYPLKGPDLAEARPLARGHTRGRKAVLYVRDDPLGIAQAQILNQNLKAIGLDVETKAFPGRLLFESVTRPGEPYDLALVAFGTTLRDPSEQIERFHGRWVGQPGFLNWSYFDSPKFNRLMDQAARLSGDERYRAYGELDVQLSRDAAPAIPFANLTELTFVSARVGCIVLNPALDLTAVCLK